MSNRTTIVVSIGRNVGNLPMSALAWEQYIEALTFRVEALNGTILGRARGRGEWDGGSEDNYILIAVFPTSLLPALRGWLSSLAAAFHQDAIGLVVNDNGTNSLVEAHHE
jgi:hypothetical protein